MGTRLLPINVSTPGIKGLNKQQSQLVLDLEWATEADNLVFGETGKLEPRKGTKNQHSIELNTSPKGMFPYQGGIIFAVGTTIYSLVDGVLSNITGAAAPTDDDWHFEEFNGACIGYQAGHTPITLLSIGSTFTQATGTQYQSGVMTVNNGRIWTVYDDVLYSSDLLINNFTGGSSSSFSLGAYWPQGGDTAVAIREWNNYLLVFGQRSIIVYANPDDPVNTMVIAEGIKTAGCISRKTIQEVSNDLLFLSESGIRSLGRTLQDGSIPMGEVSYPVRDLLKGYVSGETTSDVTSVYSQAEGFYALSFPTTGKTLVVDIKQPYRFTTWSMAFNSACTYPTGELFLGTGTYVKRYRDYWDDVTYLGAVGSTYDVVFESSWTDFGNEAAPYVKIPKTMVFQTSGNDNDTKTYKWAYDFDDTFTELSSSGDRVPMNGSGQALKVGLEFTVQGINKVIKRFSVLSKLGRMV